MKSYKLLLLYILGSSSALSSQTLPQVKKDLGKASVVVVGDTLIT